MMQYIKFGQNPSFGSRDRMQTSFFGSKFESQCAGVTLKMRSRSPKSNHFFPMSQWCLQVWSKSINWFSGWMGWAMMLGSFPCRGVLLLLLIVGQGPAVLAAGAGRVGYIFFIFFIYLQFLMSCLLGDG